MAGSVLVFTGSRLDQKNEIDFSSIGLVVQEISELYQHCKEEIIDIILVDDSGTDFKKSVARKIRRCDPMTEIWILSLENDLTDSNKDFIDGIIRYSGDIKGIKEKVKAILKARGLLLNYKIVSRSIKMKAVAETIDRLSQTDISVLIEGPSGSGKELVAKAIHDNSDRKNQPFVAVNCGALAEGVLESELFGHEKGAFTGSVSKRLGLFQRANSGTIFLDEIGETKAEMQVRLLRVLEDGTYYPVGSSVPQISNARIITATNRELTEEIKEKNFREDLYFRISVLKIVLPPLYQRKGDILPLLMHFWNKQTPLEYSDKALELMERYDWPGNIRQLKNFVERIKVLKKEAAITEPDVQSFILEQSSSATDLPVATGKTSDEAGQELIYRAILSMGNEIKLLRDLIVSHLPDESDINNISGTQLGSETTSTMEEMEKALIEKALEETGGNRKEAARQLGIGERTLYRKISKYNLR